MPDPGPSRRLEGRVALITGASRGLGAAVARRFAAEGAHLVLIARTVGGLEEIDDEIRSAGGAAATLVPLDLQQHELIDQLGASLYERFGRLDVLVGNAAILGVLSPLGHVQPAVWRQVLDINLTANWRLIRSLDPLLRQSEAGRAIFVTTGAAAKAFAYWGAYATSKAALEMTVKTYAAEVAKTAVKVNLIDPGILRTRMRETAFPGENAERLPLPETVVGHFVDLAAADCSRHGEIVRTYESGA